MSSGEVKRYVMTSRIVLGTNGKLERREINSEINSSGAWVSYTDHDRIVAELKAEVVGLKEAMHNAASGLSMEIRQRMLLEKQLAEALATVKRSLRDNEKNVSERDAVIAKQAKVIEVLKACIQKEDHRCGIWHEGRKAIEQAETIERGEA